MLSQKERIRKHLDRGRKSSDHKSLAEAELAAAEFRGQKN